MQAWERTRDRKVTWVEVLAEKWIEAGSDSESNDRPSPVTQGNDTHQRQSLGYIKMLNNFKANCRVSRRQKIVSKRSPSIWTMWTTGFVDDVGSTFASIGTEYFPLTLRRSVFSSPSTAGCLAG